jgi:hypothetical protein
MKQFTAPQSQPSIAKYAQLLAEDAQPAGTSPGKSSTLVAPTQPRSPVAAPFDPQRIGTWKDPWFGVVRLCPADGKLRFASEKSPLMVGTLMRVGERWLIDWDNDRVDLEAWVDFRDGHMRLRKTDPEGDFSSDYEDLDFTRVAGC